MEFVFGRDISYRTVRVISASRKNRRPAAVQLESAPKINQQRRRIVFCRGVFSRNLTYYAYFVLTDDIDMGGYSFLTAVIPGEFDGRGYVISNITIDTADKGILIILPS